MSVLLGIQWIPFLALDIVLLAFVFLRFLDKRGVDWTPRMIIALALGAVIGLVFASKDNAYLVWVDLIGDLYIQLITLLVAPVILLYILSGFIRLGSGERMKRIGAQSVFWLLLQSALAVLLSLAVGLGTNLGSTASSVFAQIDALEEGTLSAYAGTTRPFTEVLRGLFPSNVLGDIVSNNVPGIILIALVLSISCLAIERQEGAEAVAPFCRGVEALRKIVFAVTDFFMELTPYAVLALIAGSASNLLTSRDALRELVLLVAVIYGVCFVFTFGLGALLIAAQARLNPVRFFRKIFPAQVTAFTTQASVGTLPVTISALRERVGVSDRVADFTASLGTTIGMPGCTAVWPVLLAVFYVHAAGLSWGPQQYTVLALTAWFLSVGSAGVPGIAVVSAIALFSTVGLPIGAVVLLVPINTISDMMRTLTNVSSAAIAAAIVARRTGELDDAVFAGKRAGTEKTAD